MKAVAIEDLKNRLSAYLRELETGEVILITDRGTVVAEMRQPGPAAALDGSEAALSRLATEGALVLGLPQSSAAYRRSPLQSPRKCIDLLDAERGER